MPKRTRRSWVFRALVRLFPPDFRDRHGREMEGVFERMREEWEQHKGGTDPLFWAKLLLDAVSGASKEWSTTLGDTIRSAKAVTPGEHMSALGGDLRYSLRQLAKQPIYAFTIVALMTVGVAGNAAMFRIFNGLFLRALPFDEAEQLVDLDQTAPEWELQFVGNAYPDFVAWREQNRSFQNMTVFSTRGANMTSLDGQAERVDILVATHDIDDVLRLEPLLGRFFSAEEDVPDATLVGMVSVGFWEQKFAGDSDVLGQVISLDGQSVEIIGVLPQAAEFVTEADLWLPLRLPPDDNDGWSYRGIGRLRPGVSIDQARSDLLAVHKGMIETRPVNEITFPVIDSLRDRYLGDFRLGSGFLLSAVGIVLLIACANIAGLMLARGVSRESEISVRLALGASRTRIVRQLLTESALLASVGAVAGTVLGTWCSSLLISPMALRFPRWVTFDLDWRFVAFTRNRNLLSPLVSMHAEIVTVQQRDVTL